MLRYIVNAKSKLQSNIWCTPPHIWGAHTHTGKTWKNIDQHVDGSVPDW